VIVELRRGAAVKLDTVRSVCIAWADELVGPETRGSLETVMAELPKESARTIVAADLSPAVEELVERYARRARRVTPAATETDQPMDLEFITASAASRLDALRRVLDETDPASALVFVRDAGSEPEVRDLLRSLGYGSGEGAESMVRIGLVAPPETALAILYDLPASREEMREAAGAASRTIALVQPRQVTSLRFLAAGGTVRPFTLPESGRRARDENARLREEVGRLLADGHFGRELIALEPLLDEYDGIEIAAAVLQLLENERAARRSVSAAATATQGRRETHAMPAGEMVRLFVSVGSRDNVRPGDLVGAIANQSGVSSAEVGRIDIRESYSLVEVAPPAADTVIERVNGAVIRGRRAVVRREEPRVGGSEGRRVGGSEGRRGGGSERRRGEGRAAGFGGKEGMRRDAKGGARGERKGSGPRRGDRE
jgi:ATP-dependent RNA helicase DeaD